MRRLTPHAHSIIAPAFLSGYIVKYVPPPRGTLNASGTSCPLLNVRVATPVNRLAGRLPVAVFMPMTSGNGPAPLGVVSGAVSVMVAPFWVTFTDSVPPERVAVTLAAAGGAPFGPDPQYWTCE